MVHIAYTLKHGRAKHVCSLKNKKNMQYLKKLKKYKNS